MVRGEATPFTWNFGSTSWSGIADFQPIFARSTWAVTDSEKSSINTNRKSTTRFPMSLRWTSYVTPKPPEGAQKRKTAFFGVKSHFAWRKSATKFLCVKTVSDNGLTIRTKMIGGGNPFYLKFWVKLTALEQNRRFSIYFCLKRLSRNS